MKLAASCALTALFAGAARADDGAKPPADPRDAFGFSKSPKAKSQDKKDKPVDCSDGSDFGCALATDPLADDVPFALRTWLPAKYLLSLPTADATHDLVANYALGAGRDEAGVTFPNGNGLDNRWTIEGAPADNIRTGAVDTRVPLAFLDGILVTAGGFAPRDLASTGGTIDARLRRGGDDHTIDAYAWLGWNGQARHTPILPNVYLVRSSVVDPGPFATAAVVATGPLGDILGGKGWYAAGVAPTIAAADFTFKSQTIADDDQDGVADGLPGLVSTHPISTIDRTRYTWTVPVMARVGLDRGVHHIDLTLIGTAATAARYLSNATLQAGAIDTTSVIGDGIATWQGKWEDTHARFQLAWHRNTRSESAHDPAAANIPQLLSAYVPTTLAEDHLLAARCADDAFDPFPKVPNCPIPFGWFSSGGAGPLVNSTADRPSITGDLAHRFGSNVVRIGATGEDSRLVTESRFTGTEQIRSLLPGEMTVRHFVDPNVPCTDDITKPCTFIDESTVTIRTRYTAAYAEDTWHATPDLMVDGGLRWELMWVGPVLHFSDELAPRLGASWDPLGGGKSRVWASMGRSFAFLPAGVGSPLVLRDRTADDTTFLSSTTRTVDTGLPITVVPGIEPITQDEVTLGAELALQRAVRLTGWLQGRWLRRGIETTPDGFDNPGRSGGAQATRETDLAAIELATSPTSNLVLRVGYSYGRTVGSFTGAFNPREGAVLYNSTDFDVTSVNQFGHLPTDPGQRLYFEAQRYGTVGDVTLGVSTRLTVASGRPRDALGDSGDGIIYLIERGSAGDGPLQTQANVRLAATWRQIDFTLDLINLFDRRNATNLDQIYSGGSVHPIEGGDAGDLVFLKTDAGDPAVRRSAYNVGTQFQSPFAAVLGIRRSF